MSRALTVNPVGGGTDTAFVTSVATSGSGNYVTGWMGMKLQTGSSGLRVKQLGRYKRSGNNQNHTMAIFRVSDNQRLTPASWNLTVNMTNTPVNEFQYVTLPTPVDLDPNTAYFIVTTELNGGDSWTAGPSTLAGGAGGATILNGIVSTDPNAPAGSWTPDGHALDNNGPVNFKFAP